MTRFDHVVGTRGVTVFGMSHSLAVNTDIVPPNFFGGNLILINLLIFALCAIYQIKSHEA